MDRESKRPEPLAPEALDAVSGGVGTLQTALGGATGDGDLSTLEMLHLQNLVHQHNQALDLLSTLLSSYDDTNTGIISNIR